MPDKMIEIDLNSPQLTETVKEIFLSAQPLIMLELRSVYGLLAPNTPAGILALNTCKNRLPGKTYGSISGNMESVRGLVGLPPVPDNLFDGFILRLTLKNQAPEKVSAGGKHQILFEKPAISKLVSELEQITIGAGLDLNFRNPDYAGPLCTSANLSGVIGGAITELAEARAFCAERGINLLIHSGMLGEKKGSYPIFSFDGKSFKKERSGPGEEELWSQLHHHLN